MQAIKMNVRASAFYKRWIWANAWSELVGLGSTLALGFLLFSEADSRSTTAILGSTAFAIVAGALLEGGVVGYAQARVIHVRFPVLRTRAWILATVTGAGAAWLLGMIPSTVLSLRETGAPSATAPEPGPIALLLLTAAMGAVLGPVLSTPQYFVLKRLVNGAAWWIAANALAWALGMIVIFAAIGTLPADASDLRAAVTVAASCLGAGALVGAVHGPTLLRLMERESSVC
jgi:hypothetical protein